MKGAKGLLISITGGKDLTLYEVDEAATRIREEVDQDANIIVGATFDEALEGIIRVSVVATGIDQAMNQSRPSPVSAEARIAEARIAEVTQKLRADQQRLTERVERSTPRPAVQHVAPMSPTHRESIETAARAAVEAAVMPMTAIEDVTIRPMQPKPSLFPDMTAMEQPEQEPAKAFIPPAPQPMPGRPRMPRIDELPLPAQNVLRAQRGEQPAAEHPEKRRLGLLQRLASVGLGRREDEEHSDRDIPSNVRPPIRAVPRTAAPLPPMPQRQAARPPESRGPDPVSEYAKRPTHQGLDPLGRQAPVNNSAEEDHLDIPAFLRRQAT
jgi:cell division protein FtsZ